MALRDKATMVFDGECGFCRRWIERWRECTGDRVDYLPFQEAADDFPEIPRDEYEQEVKLVMPNGQVFGGAEAVFICLNLGTSPVIFSRLAMWSYSAIPIFRRLADRSYRFVACHRTLASNVTRWLWGSDVQRPTYRNAQTWFFRALGGIFLLAFISLYSQIDGLIGPEGIQPFAPLLEMVRQQLGGMHGFLAYPTLCWLIGGSTASLHSLCWAGIALSTLLIAGIAPAACLFGLWLTYLSLVVAGQVFLSFQWDILLLETAFLSMFFAPLCLLPSRGGGPTTLALFMMRWLLFRLMLMSGVVKLTSGDASWAGLSALYYHYETQPLPTWVGWYAHQSPHWFQNISVAFVLYTEIIAPFFVFGPRRIRMAGFLSLLLLQILIAATGNYGFFNLLTAALCLILLDDKQWPRWLRRTETPIQPARQWPKIVLIPVAVLFLLFGALFLGSAFFPATHWPTPLASVYGTIEPFRTVNGYGLFRVMTRTRPEIVIEGSNDGEHWLAYEFKWKAGDTDRPPGFVAPHQPRLDWQMWFAALGTYQDNPWFVALAVKLLQGSKPVLDLLKDNPFPDAPPRYIRAVLYDYHFTDPVTRRRTGAWWRREMLGPYTPTVSLRELP